MLAVLQVFHSTSLQLNSSKCRFGHHEITLLGHLVNAAGIRPDSAKIFSMKHFPVLSSTKDVCLFIDLCSSVALSKISLISPIHSPNFLRKIHMPFLWGLKGAHAFSALVRLLTTFPLLVHLDLSVPMEVRTDVSGYEIGAVLAERQHGRDCFIAYTSCLLSASEHNYSITKHQCLALLWASSIF